jgi:ATP-dependent DNA helicase RecG
MLRLAIYGKWDAKKLSINGMKILAQVDNSFQPVYHIMQGVKQSAPSQSFAVCL